MQLIEIGFVGAIHESTVKAEQNLKGRRGRRPLHGYLKQGSQGTTLTTCRYPAVFNGVS